MPRRVGWPLGPTPFWTLVLVGLILFARLVLIRQAFAYPAGSKLIDSAEYLALANSVRMRGEFTTDASETFDRVFGYPLFLATFLSLPSRGLETALAVQHVLVLLSCMMLFQVGRSLFDERVGWAAALWLGVSPNSLFWAGTIMSETLAAFWLALAFLLVVEGLRRARFSASSTWILGGGASLALATLTRPIAVYLIPLWAALVALLGRRFPWRTGYVRLCLVFLAAALIPIGLWMGRNYLVVGQAMISTSPGRTVRDFQLARVVARVYGIPRSEAATLMAGQPNPTQFAWRVALDHPGALVLENIMGIVRTTLGTEIGSWLIVLGHAYPGSGMLEALGRGSAAAIVEAAQSFVSQRAGWMSAGLLIWGVAYTLGLVLASSRGLLRMVSIRRTGRAIPVAMALVTVAYLVLIPLANGDARFRVPAEPFLAFLAGIANWKGALPESVETHGGEFCSQRRPEEIG